MLTTPKSMFDTTYDGFPAIRLSKTTQLVAVQSLLKQKRVSYRTKIVAKRRKPPEFIVMLVGVA
jgi:hypothetical protein